MLKIAAGDIFLNFLKKSDKIGNENYPNYRYLQDP